MYKIGATPTLPENVESELSLHDMRHKVEPQPPQRPGILGPWAAQIETGLTSVNTTTDAQAAAVRAYYAADVTLYDSAAGTT